MLSFYIHWLALLVPCWAISPSSLLPSPNKKFTTQSVIPDCVYTDGCCHRIYYQPTAKRVRRKPLQIVTTGFGLNQDVSYRLGVFWCKIWGEMPEQLHPSFRVSGPFYIQCKPDQVLHRLPRVIVDPTIRDRDDITYVEDRGVCLHPARVKHVWIFAGRSKCIDIHPPYYNQIFVMWTTSNRSNNGIMNSLETNMWAEYIKIVYKDRTRKVPVKERHSPHSHGDHGEEDWDDDYTDLSDISDLSDLSGITDPFATDEEAIDLLLPGDTSDTTPVYPYAGPHTLLPGIPDAYPQSYGLPIGFPQNVPHSDQPSYPTEPYEEEYEFTYVAAVMFRPTEMVGEYIACAKGMESERMLELHVASLPVELADHL